MKYMQYIGESEMYRRNVGYPLVGVEDMGLRVYTTLFEDAMIYSEREMREIPDSELNNYTLLPPVTYKDLYENEFQDYRNDMTDEDYRRCFIEGELFEQ